jgi:hypothetical protein
VNEVKRKRKEKEKEAQRWLQGWLHAATSVQGHVAGQPRSYLMK